MKRFFSEATYSSASYFLAAFSQVLVQVVVVRSVTQVAYGNFVFANTIENLIEAIAIPRGFELAVQYAGKHWTEKKIDEADKVLSAVITTDIWINSLLYLLIVVLSYAASLLFHFNPIYIIILSLQIPGQIGYGAYKSVFVLAHKIKEQAVAEIIFTLFQLALSLVLVLNYGMMGYIISLVVASLFKTILNRHYVKAWRVEKKGRSGKKRRVGQEDDAKSEPQIDIKEWTRFSLHSLSRSGLNSIANQADVLLVSFFQGPQSTAIYKVAKSISALPVSIISPLWSLFRPRILAAYHRQNSQKVFKLVAYPSLLIIGISSIFVAIIYPFSAQIFERAYGAAYGTAAIPFLLLLIGQALSRGATGWFSFWVVTSNSIRFGTAAYGILVGSMFFWILFIGRSSLNLVAIAVLISMATYSLLCWNAFIKATFDGTSRSN